MGFNSWKDNSATLGWVGFKKPDSEVGARLAIAGAERRRGRGMRGVWLSGWGSLASVRGTTRGGKGELSIRKRKRVSLDGRTAPYGWSSDVIERWRGGW